LTLVCCFKIELEECKKNIKLENLVGNKVILNTRIVLKDL
jgi:hypothetical protein